MTATRPLARRAELLRIWGEDRLVAIVRTATAEEALACGRAVAKGGARLVEITLTVPDADLVIARLAEELPDVIVGAGTVLSRAQAQAAMLAGARFLVSPAVLPELVEVARAHDGMAMLGAFSPTEILAAANAGSDAIKIYPVGAVGGPAYLRRIGGVLAGLPLVPTGDIELAEIPAYREAGCAGFGIGAPLVRADLVAKGQEAEVARVVQAFLAATRA